MADGNRKAEPTQTKPQSRLVIRNIGLLLSGDLQNPILDADTVVAVDGKIAVIGKQKDIDTENATLVIDAKGTTDGDHFAHHIEKEASCLGIFADRSDRLADGRRRAR